MSFKHHSLGRAFVVKSQPEEPIIERIHATPHRGVLGVTGGGSGAVSQLLTVAGASRTVLEAVVPYSERSLRDWVGGRIDSSCSEATARAMAMAAYRRARRFEGCETDQPDELFGIGCTASLASDRQKRGTHRVHVALQTLDRTAVWNLTLDKGKRTRTEEEFEAARLILHAVEDACQLNTTEQGSNPKYKAAACDQLTAREKHASPLWIEMRWGDGMTALVDTHNGGMERVASSNYGKTPGPWVLFPGAFSPAHEGHRLMSEIAGETLGRVVTLELSLDNVDKPPLDYLAIADRLRCIAAVMPDTQVWLTRTDTFVKKSNKFGKATFVVGADTISRIGDLRYYEGDSALRDIAIGKIASNDCRFLVFGRQKEGGFETLEDLTLPPALRALCQGVPETAFRHDISSTEIRQTTSERTTDQHGSAQM